MKLEHIVALAVRLFAIALAVYALRNGISLVPYFHDQEWQIASYAYAALVACFLLLAIYLWYFPLTVSRRLVAFREPGEADIGSATSDELQIIGFTILGIYLLFYVLSDVIYWGFIWFISNRNQGVPIELSLEQVASMLSTAIELVFVLFLILGAKGIVRLIRKLRYGRGV